MFVTEDIRYIGVNDHDVDLFEGQYTVENGMSYNSYVILDEKVAVMDTVDAHFGVEWLQNLETELKPGEGLDNVRYAAIDTLAGSHALMMGFLVELAFLSK